MTYLTSSFLLSDLRWLFSLLSHRFAIHFSSPPVRPLLLCFRFVSYRTFRFVCACSPVPHGWRGKRPFQRNGEGSIQLHHRRSCTCLNSLIGQSGVRCAYLSHVFAVRLGAMLGSPPCHLPHHPLSTHKLIELIKTSRSP